MRRLVSWREKGRGLHLDVKCRLLPRIQVVEPLMGGQGSCPCDRPKALPRLLFT